MNRSLITRAASPLVGTFMLPLVLGLTACPSDDGPGGNAEEESGGIASLSNSGDGDGDGAGDGDGDGGGNELPGDGDGDGDPTGGPTCGEVSIVPEYIPPAVMLVVDASGSMIQFDWDHDLDGDTPNESRWATLHRVVETIMGEFGPSMRAGIKRFPSEGACVPNPGCYNLTACTVTATPEVNVALDNGSAILASIPPGDDDGSSVAGGTPSTKGINSAVTHLIAQSAEIPRYILFITDGAANCTPGFDMPDVLEVYDETLEPTVQAARVDHNITTFAIGIDIINQLLGVPIDGAPEANPYERLNDVALAGGAARPGVEKFYNSTNQDELLTALSGIINEITECIIDLTDTDEGAPDPVQIPYITFEAGGQAVPFVEDCENEDGWSWIDEGLIVTFCGSYCDDFKSGGTTFDGTYGCPPPG
jgi:hypothetical protein